MAKYLSMRKWITLFANRNSLLCINRSFSSKSCHYEVLGVEKKATKKDIREAYLKKSKQFHPDSNPNDETLHGKFVQVTEAYEVLSDSNKRDMYDNLKSNAYTQHRRYATGNPNNPFGGYREPEWEIDFETRRRMYAQFYNTTYPEYQKQMAEEYTTRRVRSQKIVAFAALFTLLFAVFNYLRIQRHHVVYQKVMEERTAENAAFLTQRKYGYGEYLKRVAESKLSNES